MKNVYLTKRKTHYDKVYKSLRRIAKDQYMGAVLSRALNLRPLAVFKNKNQ